MAAGEIATLVTDATPYLTAALTAYGAAVLTKVRDDAADATVGLGRRLLQRIFGGRDDEEPLPVPLAEVVDAPDDADALGALRLAIRRELEGDYRPRRRLTPRLMDAAAASRPRSRGRWRCRACRTRAWHVLS